MPKAEDNENENPSSEPWSYSGNRDFLEYGQRHGLLETERTVSGLKRICNCFGVTERYCKGCLPYFLLFMYPTIYLFGYYSGFVSNHVCEGSNT